MEWYLYYLIVGVYVSLITYGTSIVYKIQNKDYIRINKIITWKILYGMPLIILFWWLMIVVYGFSTMEGSEAKQKLIAIEVDNMFKLEN